eukprot:2524676-Rhodomonas_salina.1
MLRFAQNALNAVDAVNSLSVRMEPMLSAVTKRKSHSSSSGSILVVVGVAHMKLRPPTMKSR